MNMDPNASLFVRERQRNEKIPQHMNGLTSTPFRWATAAEKRERRTAGIYGTRANLNPTQSRWKVERKRGVAVSERAMLHI